MPIVVRPYRTSDDEAIERLNHRLAESGIPHTQFRGVEGSEREPLPRETLFVVADDDEVRGGAFVREFPFRVGEATVTVGSVKFPLSESLIDRRFAGVPAALLMQLARQQPRLMAVGMGGAEGPFSQVLQRLGWAPGYVETLLCPLRPDRVLRALPHVQRDPRLRRLARILQATGVSQLSSLAASPVLSRKNKAAREGVAVREVPAFPQDLPSAAPIGSAGYRAGMLRTPEVLNWMFPAEASRLHRFVVETGGVPCGWFAYQVVDFRQPGAPSQFGPLLIAFVLESYAPPDQSNAVASWLLEHGIQAGVDLIIANHSQPVWHRAFRRAGFLRGPRRFGCFRSPGLERTLRDHALTADDIWVTRGDDGYFTL